MATTRVWNISDNPAMDNPPSMPMMLFGRTVAPGRYVEVDEAELTNAHKLNKEVASGLVYVGKSAPASYLSAKSQGPKAALAKGVARSRGAEAASEDPAPMAEMSASLKMKAKLSKK